MADQYLWQKQAALSQLGLATIPSLKGRACRQNDRETHTGAGEQLWCLGCAGSKQQKPAELSDMASPAEPLTRAGLEPHGTEVLTDQQDGDETLQSYAIA